MSSRRTKNSGMKRPSQLPLNRSVGAMSRRRRHHQCRRIRRRASSPACPRRLVAARGGGGRDSRRRASSIACATPSACATLDSHRAGLCRLGAALHPLSRQAPSARPGRGRGRGLPDSTGRRAQRGVVDAEPGQVGVAVPVPRGARHAAALARRGRLGAKASRRLPVVLTPREVRELLANLEGGTRAWWRRCSTAPACACSKGCACASRTSNSSAARSSCATARAAKIASPSCPRT